MKKQNRVYALVSIGAKMAMWNADMTMGPKMTANNDIFGSDKALKYSIKNLWKMQGKKVIYIKHRNDKFALMPLKDIYEAEFNEAIPDKKKDANANTKVLNNLLKAIDVRQFGATFAAGDAYPNLGITGVVQVGQAFNLWEDANVEVIDILSPFVNPKKDAEMTSIGNKTVVDEAHYLYPITVNPANYDNLIGVVEGFEGYTEEDYEELKKALLMCASALDTNSKAGCENEFALFVNMKNGSEAFLANLNSYVSLYDSNEDGLRIIDITKLQEFLFEFDDEIDSIEVFVNDKKLSLKHLKNDKLIIKNMNGQTL